MVLSKWIVFGQVTSSGGCKSSQKNAWVVADETTGSKVAERLVRAPGNGVLG